MKKFGFERPLSIQAQVRENFYLRDCLSVVHVWDLCVVGQGAAASAMPACQVHACVAPGYTMSPPDPQLLTKRLDMPVPLWFLAVTLRLATLSSVHLDAAFTSTPSSTAVRVAFTNQRQLKAARGRRRSQHGCSCTSFVKTAAWPVWFITLCALLPLCTLQVLPTIMNGRDCITSLTNANTMTMPVSFSSHELPYVSCFCVCCRLCRPS